ncbi:unnamed protein product [Ectocarpus sp. 8 AP-2014]
MRFACSNGTPVAHNVPNCRGGFSAYPVLTYRGPPEKNRRVLVSARQIRQRNKKRISGDVRGHYRDDMCHSGGGGRTYSRRYHDATNLTCACHGRPLDTGDTRARLHTGTNDHTPLFLTAAANDGSHSCWSPGHCCCGAGRGERGCTYVPARDAGNKKGGVFILTVFF